MQAERSPFPCAWPGIALEGVGIDALRSRQGTYGLYAFEHLPSLPVALDGSFGWLASWPDAPEWGIDQEAGEATPAALARLTEAEADLPPPFVRFLSERTLQRKVRSITACYVSLSPVAVPSPIGGGRLVRFLSDQQGCMFWYLFLAPDGDHAVVASPDFYGAPEEELEWEPADPRNLVFCAESFELFVCRYWLENEIGFASCYLLPDQEPGMPPAAAERYLAAYRQRALAVAPGAGSG